MPRRGVAACLSLLVFLAPAQAVNLGESPTPAEIPQLPAPSARTPELPLILPPVETTRELGSQALPFQEIPQVQAAQTESMRRQGRASGEQARETSGQAFGETRTAAAPGSVASVAVPSLPSAPRPRLARWKKAVIGAAAVVAVAVGAYHFYSPSLKPVKPPINVVDVRESAFGLRADPTAGVTLNGDGTLRLTGTGKLAGAAISDDGRAAVTIGADGSWKLWDLEKTRASKPARYPGKAVAAAFADGGRTLLLLDEDGTVRALDRRTGEARAIAPQGGLGGIERRAFSPDGKRVSVSTRGGRVVIVDVTAGRSTAFKAEGSVLALAETVDGTVVLTSAAGKMKVWDVKPGQAPSTRMEKIVFGATLGASAVNADGSKVAAAGMFLGSHGVILLDVASESARYLSSQELQLGAAKVAAVAVDGSGARVAIGASDGRVWLWEPGGAGLKLLGKASAGASVSITADGDAALAADLAGGVSIWPLPH